MNSRTTPEAELIITAFDAVDYLRSNGHGRAAGALHEAACALVRGICADTYESDSTEADAINSIVRPLG